MGYYLQSMTNPIDQNSGIIFPAGTSAKPKTQASGIVDTNSNPIVTNRLSDFHIFDPEEFDGVTIQAAIKPFLEKTNGVYFPEKPSENDDFGLDGVHGYSKIVDRIRSKLVKPVLQASKPSLFGLSAKPVKGVLFYGPPGNGKTFIAEKLGEELDARKYDINLGNQGDIHIYELEKNITNTFNAARGEAISTGKPSLIILDEAESMLGTREGEYHSHKRDAVGTLIREMSSEQNKNVYVVLMTNHPEALDEAAIRSQRIDEFIEIPMPNQSTRKDILEYLFSEYPYVRYDEIRRPGGINLNELAARTKDFTVADLKTFYENVVRKAVDANLEYIDSEAVRLALSEAKRSLSNEQIAKYEAISRKFTGSED